MARFRPPPLRELRAGPFAGVRDTKDATSLAATLANSMVNVYARDPARKGAVLGRPGVTVCASTLAGPLGVPGNRRVQGIGQLERLDGTRYTVAVAGGLFYRYSWGTDTWTAVALGGGAALSATAPAVYFATLADQLIVSDGVNPPWLWNGTTFTVLTACPALYGQPWTHVGRLWGIKASDRTTLVWSEPNQPAVGYEATISGTVYRNAWSLGQTARGALVAGRGFNDRMVLWRARSTTEVYGLVDSDFAASATRESVSETVGLGAPQALTVVNGTCTWLTADGELAVLRPGGGVRLISEEIAEAAWTLTMPALSTTLATYDPLTGLSLFAVPVHGALVPQDCWPIHTTNDQPQGTWTGWGAMTALATVLDDAGNPIRLHGDADGRVYRHGWPRGVLWDDTLPTSAGGATTTTRAIRHVVRTAPLGWSEHTEKFWDRADFILRARSRVTSCVLQPIGPYGVATAQAITPTSPAARWDAADWDAAQWAPEGIDQHFTAGLETHGRWQQLEVRHEVLGEQFGLLTATLWAQDVAAYPGVA